MTGGNLLLSFRDVLSISVRLVRTEPNQSPSQHGTCAASRLSPGVCGRRQCLPASGFWMWEKIPGIYHDLPQHMLGIFQVIKTPSTLGNIYHESLAGNCEAPSTCSPLSPCFLPTNLSDDEKIVITAMISYH